jgi:hypothetical protein
MHILKWFAKVFTIALMMVSPMLYLIYQSSKVIDSQMKNYMYDQHEISPGESLKAVNDLTLNLGFAYSYTFLTGTLLILIAIGMFFRKIVNNYRSIKHSQNFRDVVKGVQIESELDDEFDSVNMFDYSKRKSIKAKNRKRSGIK